MDFELIGKFCTLTNATREDAKTYLKLTEGNVERAIDLYLEIGGVDLTDVVDTRTTTNPQQSTSATFVDAERTRNTFDSDAELARSLAQQESSAIRAPIAPKRDILVGGDQNDHVGLDGGMIRRGVPRSRRSRDNIYRTFAGDALPHRMGPSDEKATRLADLFGPPFDIINKENFERTRNKAKIEGKWLMVDIQNIGEFACQVLNRDLWSDKTVKDVIKADFLFLQFNSESPDGRQYINYYPISSYPHIAIIDPRTGERVIEMNANKIAPNEFIISITDFLNKYSLKEPKKQTPTSKQSTNKAVTEMSEEEQIGAALKKSLEEQPKEKSASESEIDEIEDTEEEDSMTEEPVSTFDSIQPVEREEAQGPTSAMIKFRLADGQTVIRRFGKLDPVRYLFEFIKTVPNLKDQEFELVCHRNNLISIVDQTIEEAGLSSSLVNVVLG